MTFAPAVCNCTAQVQLQTAIVAPQKSTKSRDSDFLVACGTKSD